MTDVPALEAFVAVARTGSVVGAAEKLSRTQPSISARMQALEAAWSTKLFRRHARGMTLTPEGAKLLPLAEAALRSLGALDQAAGLPMAGHDELRIGAGDALGRQLVPRALAKLLKERPGISIRLLEGPAPRLREALRAGEVDLVLTIAPDDGPDAGLTVAPLTTSTVDVLARPDERLGSSVDIRKLRGRRLVTLQRGSGFRRHLESACAAAGVPFQPAVEVGNLSLVRRFVLAGLGVAPVPSVAFEREKGSPPVRRHRLRGVPVVSYVVAARTGVSLTPVAERFLSLLRAE